MVWIFSIQTVEPLQTKKESLPTACKLGTNFNPQALDSCIMSGAKAKLAVPKNWEGGTTHEPHMKDPRFGPFRIIIYTDVALFSPPRSPLIREGQPYSSTAWRKTARTVDARLFVLARRAVIL